MTAAPGILLDVEGHLPIVASSVPPPVESTARPLAGRGAFRAMYDA